MSTVYISHLCSSKVQKNNNQFKKIFKMKICGVDFAPLNTPINRRLQTFGVFTWGIIFLSLGPLVLLTLYQLLYTSFWPLTLAYVAWYIYDLDTCNRGARRNQWLRQLRIWKYYAQYFPVKLIKTAELDPERQGNYLLGEQRFKKRLFKPFSTIVIRKPSPWYSMLWNLCRLRHRRL